jgi:potassium-dependent mechanosensitive channel
MPRESVWRFLVCAGLALSATVCAHAVHAQDVQPVQLTSDAVQPVTDPAAVTQQQIDGFQQKIAAQSELSEDEKKELDDLVAQATSDLKTAETARAQAAEAELQAANIPGVQSSLEQQLAKPTVAATIAPELSLSDLEAEQLKLQADIARIEQDLKQPTIDLAARTATRTSLRTALTELAALLNEIDQKLQEPPPETEAPLLSEARKLALAAQKQSVEARLNAARKELARYDASDAANLPSLRREAATRDLNAKRRRLEAVRNEINARRQAEAERRAREARLKALSADPVLKPIFEKNQEIARTEQELRIQHEDDKELLDEVEAELKKVEEDFAEARKLDEDVGLEKRGIWLRKQRENLRELEDLHQRVSERTDRATDVLFSFYERTDELSGLNDIEAVADALTAEAATAGTIDHDKFREDAVQVLRSQAVNLSKLVDEYAAYSDTLDLLASQTIKLRTEATQFADFLDERILWVRSHLPLSLASLASESRTLSEVLSVQTWISAAKSLGWDAADHLLLYGNVALLLGFLLLRRGRFGRQLQDVARRAGGRVNVSMAPTVHCLILTILLALVWPGLILFVAWRLHESTISSPQLHVAALNLMRLASLFFLLEFVRQTIRPLGLADAHFDWNGKTLRGVRHVLRIVMLVGLPLAAAAACLHQQEQGSRRDDVERLLFIAALLVLLLFSHMMFHPKRGALSQLKALQDGGWFDRLSYLWYVLGLAVSIALIVLTALGYFDSAVRLAIRVQRTAWLIVGAVYLHALIGRWLMLRHRRLRIDEARERLAAAQETAAGSPEGGAPLPDVDTARADIDAINEQSYRLLTTMLAVGCLVGLWWIWVDVLPAIRFLDRWPLWNTTVQTLVTETNAAGDTINRPDYEVHSVTVVSLIQLLVIVLLTATAARNVPGLLEMSILARLPIDRSTAYAVTSLTRYALVLIGLILAGQSLKLSWSNIQWLAAALTFGLGFGLQEIFANFVSGIIILFEQPVRVGDIVTIDGVSGVVNRIRIRATTIVDWDRKEYIVPNREFITGRLLNWTLSDKMNRVVVNVGVAYGSNVPQVREVILKVLEEHPNVLTDPAPLVTFESFGDSALNFVARAYLPSLDNRLATIHDLHAAIHDRLAQAGIAIPFPQRDLHLRTSVTIDEAARGHLASNGRSEQDGHAVEKASAGSSHN